MAATDKQKYYILYAAAGVIVAGIVVTWYFAKRSMNHYEGREVQALLTKTNLATDKHYQQAAHNMVSQLIKDRKLTLTSGHRSALEEIMARAFKERMTIWTADRLAGETAETSQRKEDASWQKHWQEVETALAKYREKQ
ncbi:MAG: hypothetical protein ABI579_02015 [Candidatus Sumerlaeota bacterium]